MKCIFIILTLVIFFVNSFSTYAQQESETHSQQNLPPKKIQFTPLGEEYLKNNNMNFDSKNDVRYDVVLFSKYRDAEQVKFDKSSLIFNQIASNMRRIIKQQFIPDRAFLEQNSLFYTVKNKEEKHEDFLIQYLTNGYDIAYIAYKMEGDISVLVAVTDDIFFGATYIYLQLPDKKINQKNAMELLQKIMMPDAFKMLVIADQKNVHKFNDPVIPVYFSDNSLCFVRVDIFNTTMPARGGLLKIWFEQRKKADIRHADTIRLKNIIDRYEKTFVEQCKELVNTPQGRSELIALIDSDNIRKELGKDYETSYRDLQAIPYSALYYYYTDGRPPAVQWLDYNKFKNKDYYIRSNRIKKDMPWYTLEDELTSPIEHKSIRKLLKSSDIKTKQFGLSLVSITRSKSLLPDLLDMTNDKVLVRVASLNILPEGKSNIPEYNFFVYPIIAQLGDARTLTTLRQQQASSKKVQNNIELAIEDIKRHLAERDRQRQSWLDLRREVREKKIVVTGGKIVDIDKPDPEPVSVDGFRNWSTTDGLFKTNAKFVALIDVTNDDGKIIDRDVQLLRKDGKKVAIELSGLRSTDREYVRQQLEPLRDWATLDGSLKIKAKLLGKFDKEIILEESDGITTLVQIENLTDKDKEYLKQKTLSPHSKYAF